MQGPLIVQDEVKLENEEDDVEIEVEKEEEEKDREIEDEEEEIKSAEGKVNVKFFIASVFSLSPA